MYTINQLQEIISQEINKLNFGGKPENLYEPIKYSIETGGKRIRPALVLAACNIFSKSVVPAISVALAFEIFHNFTLLHDDIMDDSPIRRNKETVHKKWNTNVAILSGDAMLIKSYDFLNDLSPELFLRVFPVFNQTALQVCEGQQYDMDFESQDFVSAQAYLEMIKLKTSVLIAASLKAGAICGGANKKDVNLLYEFGLNIGLAFQIQDDLLDVYGDEKKFGKQNGNDIITGKKTFLLIKAFEKADHYNLKKLTSIVNDKNIQNKEKVDSVIKVFDNFNIKELTEHEIRKFHNKAIDALNKISVENERKTILLDFSDLIMCREQ